MIYINGRFLINNPTGIENFAYGMCKAMLEKGIKFIVTDQKIIEQCHGIIQGMSGSPIIQNNKLIGCVTHASKSEILEGYGMYIQWMIDNE